MTEWEIDQTKMPSHLPVSRPSSSRPLRSSRRPDLLQAISREPEPTTGRRENVRRGAGKAGAGSSIPDRAAASAPPLLLLSLLCSAAPGARRKEKEQSSRLFLPRSSLPFLRFLSIFRDRDRRAQDSQSRAEKERRPKEAGKRRRETKQAAAPGRACLCRCRQNDVFLRHRLSSSFDIAINSLISLCTNSPRRCRGADSRGGPSGQTTRRSPPTRSRTRRRPRRSEVFWMMIGRKGSRRERRRVGQRRMKVQKKTSRRRRECGRLGRLSRSLARINQQSTNTVTGSWGRERERRGGDDGGAAERLEPPLCRLLLPPPAALRCVRRRREKHISFSHQLRDFLVIGSCVKGRSPGVSSHGLEEGSCFLGARPDAARLQEER